MKKFFMALIAVTVLFSSIASADSLTPAAAEPVPPLEEYSRNAWPVTAETYADLLNNMDARYGQVYMVKGIVTEVLSQSPLRVVVNTGEDGNPQPVVIERSEQLSFSWEEGGCYWIYADASSLLDNMPVLIARYTLIPPAADSADTAAAADGE